MELREELEHKNAQYEKLRLEVSFLNILNLIVMECSHIFYTHYISLQNNYFFMYIWWEIDFLMYLLPLNSKIKVKFLYGTVFEILYFFSFYDHFLLDKSYLELEMSDLIVLGTQFKVLRWQAHMYNRIFDCLSSSEYMDTNIAHF